MKMTVRFLCSLVLIFSLYTLAAASDTGPTVDSATAQKMLLEGNKRHVDGKAGHPHQDAARRTEVAKGQHPFAVIVSCADSRVPPEILFDQGVGDLFVIRLAGNVLDDAALGSLEYAAEHLGVHYILILGHERCGAVDATVKGGEAPGHIGSLVKAIQPAVDKAKGQSGDLLDNAVKANVAMGVQQVKSSAPILKEMVDKGVLTVKGARYDLDDGNVEIIP